MGTVVQFAAKSQQSDHDLSLRLTGHNAELLASAANEIVATATWVAATTGIVNSCFLSGRTTSPRFLKRCLPPDPVIFEAFKLEFQSHEPTRIMLARSAELKTYLRAAKLALDEVIHDTRRGGPDRKHLQLRVCDLWQAAAESALHAIYALEDTVGVQRIGLQQEQVRTLSEALILARDGGSPFQQEGIAALPSWVEQRQSKRATLNMRAQLTADGRTCDIIVLNASLGGFGIEGAEKLTQDNWASIRLQNGRLFVGQVAWSAGRRAGIRFRRTLRPDDPLLAG